MIPAISRKPTTRSWRAEVASPTAKRRREASRNRPPPSAHARAGVLHDVATPTQDRAGCAREPSSDFACSSYLLKPNLQFTLYFLLPFYHFLPLAFLTLTHSFSFSGLHPEIKVDELRTRNMWKETLLSIIYYNSKAKKEKASKIGSKEYSVN